MSSKIKVDTIENVAGSGNVSLGSGHNLVVPGSVTVTTTTHANASVFKSTGNTQIMLQDTDASANDQFWGLQNSGGEFNILTCNDDRASGFVTPMTITQAGVVSHPNQPSFAGRSPRPYDSSNATINTGVNLYFDSVSHNNGNHFNNASSGSGSGVFTCPVAGYYLVQAFCLIDNDAGGTELARIAFLKNGTEVFVGYDNGHDTTSTVYDGTIACGGVVKCNANDTITFRVTAGKVHSQAESAVSIHMLC